MFSGKVAVVTGSARGLGRAIAEKLAENKASVVITDISADSIKKTAEEIASKYSVKTLALPCDVSDFKKCHELADEIHSKMGSIDIWVNNAGVLRDDLIMRMKEEDWDLVLKVNLKGVFNGIQSASKVMIKQRSGKIVNISSVSGLVSIAGQANYSASKAGVISLTRTAAREFASRNINVNAVAPGYIQTDMTGALPEKVQVALKDQIPLKRSGTPVDIANAVKFLCSEDASFITGVILRVDGGMVIGY